MLSVWLLLFILGTGSAGAATLPAPGAFEIQGSNGYAIRVMGNVASHGSPSKVTVLVSKGKSYAAYQAPAKATATSFEADLGSLGRIDVSYHPTGQTRTRRGTCKAPITFAVGYYEGTIEFHGEGGSVKATGKSGTFTYESADRKTVKANVTPPAPFTGSADFSKRAHGKAKWKGDLAVDFPGHPDVKLTEPKALASLSLHVRISQDLTATAATRPPPARLHRPPLH